MDGFRTILVTTDFSDTSKRAFEPAVTLARRFGSKVLVVYVSEDRLPPLIGEYVVARVQEIHEAHREHATKELEKLVAEHFLKHVEAEPLVGFGIPHKEIVELAGKRNVDLIIMATHGRGFLTHALFGSTTERVLRRAPCPVLTVREQLSEESPAS